MKQYFKEIRLINSQRQPPNQKYKLDLIYQTKKSTTVKTTKLKCVCGDYIKESSFHTFQKGRDIFTLKYDLQEY